MQMLVLMMLKCKFQFFDCWRWFGYCYVLLAADGWYDLVIKHEFNQIFESVMNDGVVYT